MEGLVTPGMIPYKRTGRQLDFLEQVRPAFRVVFPEWYPDLIRRADCSPRSIGSPSAGSAPRTIRW